LVVNQFTVVEGHHNRRPDVEIFINGLPLAVVELKNPADEEATIWTAFNQLQTYKQQIPSLFIYNEVLIISDGLDACVGSLTANREWLSPWRTIEGEKLAPANMLQLFVISRLINYFFFDFHSTLFYHSIHPSTGNERQVIFEMIKST
jgi:type I restriction enzyme R subunit